jgi:hypothetical protein
MRVLLSWEKEQEKIILDGKGVLALDLNTNMLRVQSPINVKYAKPLNRNLRAVCIMTMTT